MEQISRENLDKQPTSNTKEENLEFKKSIEIEEKIIRDLVKEDGTKENDEEQTKEWINKYGKRFRKIIDENPELLKDKEKLKQELYKEKAH